MTRLSAVNMEEREALKREIEVLQDLIDNHKRIHGDTPFTRVQPPEAQRSSRAHGTILGNSYGSRGRNDPPQNHGSWKRKYSLRHKSPQSAHPFISTSCNHRDATPPVSSGGAPHSPRDVTRTTATVTTNVSRKAEPLVPRHEHSKAESCSASEGTQLMAESRRVFPPGSTDPNRRHRLAPVATAAPAVLTTITPSVAALPKLAKQPPSNLSSHSGHCQTTKSVSTNSKFVWVKTQNVKGQSSSVSTPAGKTGNDLPPSKPGAESTVASTVWKKTPGKKPPRRLTQVSVSPKASKYKWVSSYAQSKISRKSMSSKLPLPQRALETDDTLRKAKTALTSPAKTKKEVATSSRSSHYSWKAVAAAGPAVPRRSSFYWTPDKRRVREGFSSGTLRTILPCPPSSSCSPGPFKLHSQMKIIRRSANSGSEKVSSTPGGRLTTPGRPPASLRGPTGARRTSSRELVSFGRHKLRRLVTSVTRTSPPSTFSSGALPDFGSSRYRSRRGPSAAHAHQDPPSLSWRARRVQSARSFLQSRLRTHQDTHPSSSQHWRGGSMCWIRGSLYRVSANKLSRTVASGPAVNRTGKSFSSTQTSMMTWNRCSSTRHLASRAVQRSLAIIRQARQKKQAKQYCMYYNRFGKCNRGNSCPYIHDPDKVAVCTRFLRGTCKKAEGICPFSHKVAKEKMPVCSYFLKGICSNNDCPYSHVYVSKKAEVCEDFVKGYCPEGEKCKKKHTLVCPDFSKMGSCPQGASCKLQHRQRAKRTSASTADTPAKRARSREPPNRPGPPGAGGPDRQATPPLDLPSFISLSSSPEEADAPDPQLADPRHGKETRLQIKPRL